jgi:acetylornithine deacetylase/succinyl-diaminopimelate desuccinylase-like protein
VADLPDHAAPAIRAGPPRSTEDRIVGTALARAGASMPLRLRELADWLAIPSVSGISLHERDVRRAARFFEDHLRRAGATTTRLTTGGADVIVGCVAGPPGSPVVVVYGHYDVQPAGPGWTSPAFRPTLSGGSLIARGANDDKGQLFAVIAALRAWHESGGVPSTIVVIGEGAEEVGSPGLAGALAGIAKQVKPDLVLACDTERAVDGIPAVTISQRGHAALSLRVDVGGHPVHAGRLGGAVVDPSMVLAQVLIRIQAAVPDMAHGRRRQPDQPSNGDPLVQVRDNSTIRRLAVGRATLDGSLDRRITTDAALSVVQLRAGTGRAAVPSRASARLDVRFPAEVDVRTAVGKLARLARATAPAGVVVHMAADAISPGYAEIPRRGTLEAVNNACRAVYGRSLPLVRSGGTLPAAGLLADAFGIAPVLLGLGTPGGGAHGPDEHLDLAGWVRAVRLLVCLLAQPMAENTMDDCRRPQGTRPQRDSKAHASKYPCDGAISQRVWRPYDRQPTVCLSQSPKLSAAGRAVT